MPIYFCFILLLKIYCFSYMIYILYSLTSLHYTNPILIFFLLPGFDPSFRDMLRCWRQALEYVSRRCVLSGASLVAVDSLGLFFFHAWICMYYSFVGLVSNFSINTVFIYWHSIYLLYLLFFVKRCYMYCFCGSRLVSKIMTGELCYSFIVFAVTYLVSCTSIYTCCLIA